MEYTCGLVCCHLNFREYFIHVLTSKTKENFGLSCELRNCCQCSGFTVLVHRYSQVKNVTELSAFFQDVEMKEEGTRHMLILYNVRMDMAGGVDFSAANAKSNAQLRVKGDAMFIRHSFKIPAVS